jgi:hypothetical protein
MRIEQARHSLEEVGFQITDEGLAHWRARLAGLDARYTPEERRAGWAQIWQRMQERLAAERSAEQAGEQARDGRPAGEQRADER